MKKLLATDELFLEASQRKTTLALIQEPYVGAKTTLKSYRGARIFQSVDQKGGIVKAAIAVFDAAVDVIQYPDLTTNNIAVVGIKTRAWRITVVSVYLEKDQPLEPYLEHLTKIVEKIGPRRLIVAGDGNAWNTWWGSVCTKSRGVELLSTLDDLGLHVINSNRSEPTFDTIRDGTRFTSHVDVTTCSSDMLPLVDGWKINQGLTSSDHKAITFNITLTKSHGTQITRTTRIYNTNRANWDQFREKLNQFLTEHNITHTSIQHITNTQQIETAIQTYTQAITHACTHTLKLKILTETLNLPWWSDELAALKREVVTRRRRIRCAAPIRRRKVVDEYLKKKTEYESEVEQARLRSWKDFCGKQDRESVWEGIYRIMSRTKSREEDLPLNDGSKMLDPAGSAKLLADTFYPEDQESTDNADHRQIRLEAECVNDGQQNEHCDPPFTQVELKMAMAAFNPKKAPGSDGFTADICANAVASDYPLFLALLNKCLQLGYFPVIWKEATVIALRKPGKEDYTAPKSYRPIGLLPVLGKCLERMLVTRLRFYLVPRTSTHQYGFMPQRSTEDSLYVLLAHIRDKLKQKMLITVISLDIEGAFDSAWWPAIRVRLAEEKCPVNLRRVVDSYLSNRKVKVRYAGEECVKGTTKGCVQGSIGGPTLWNLLLDPLLHELERKGEYIQAFADDVVLVVDAQTALEIEIRANAALEHIRAWGVKNKLKFAPQKTVAMVITNKLKYDAPRLRMGGSDIGLSKQIKLLGVTIDEKLTFNSHVANVCRKALNFYKQLARTAKIHWGLKPEVIKTIYTAVVEPTVMYAASVWAPATTKIMVRKELDSVQRGFMQKMMKSYKTASLNSVLLLAGLLPLDIRIREAAQLYEIKRGYSRRAIADREVETAVPFSSMPHPATRKELNFICLGDAAALEQYRNDDGLNIFTDGSKIEGKVGAALSIRDGAEETSTRKLKLDQCCSVYQAELLALAEATEKAAKSKRKCCNIYCDSRSALETVTNLTSPHPLAVKTRANVQKLIDEHKIVNLFWVKAHAGLEGNERADQLAKESALHLKRRADYDRCPISFVKRQIRHGSLDEWNQRYKNESVASVTKVFFPDAIMSFPVIRRIDLNHVLVQMFTGHGGFSEYLHRFKCKESPACPCGSGAEETVVHILMECSIFGKQRFEMECLIDEKICKDNICKIIADRYKQKTFINYCKNIVIIVAKKNGCKNLGALPSIQFDRVSATPTQTSST